MTADANLKPIMVTVATALAVTGLGRTKFYELVKEGQIRTRRIGRRTLAVYADLESLASDEAGSARRPRCGSSR